MLWLLFATLVYAHAVGTSSEYTDDRLQPAQHIGDNKTQQQQPFYDMPLETAEQFKRSVQGNLRTVSFIAGCLLLSIAVLECVCLSDACVSRRINRNRKLPIGVAPTSE